MTRRLRPGLTSGLTTLAVLCSAVFVSMPATVYAEDVLEGNPVVRRQLQYRASRHEIGALGASTLGDIYMRNVLPGMRYDWHLFEWLSIGTRLHLGVPLPTATFEQIEAKVSANNETFDMEASHLRFVGLGHVSVSPLVGKMLLYGENAADFDLHFDLMAGMVNVGSSGKNLKAGWTTAFGLGGGIRVFLSKVVALTFDIQTIAVDRALSVNRDNKAAGAKARFNPLISVGLSMLLPTKLTRGQ